MNQEQKTFNFERAVSHQKMAAKVLDGILNNFISVECLLEWLSDKNNTNEKNIFIEQYECSQIAFVSYFLTFLREQSSRDFQVYDVETPRKISNPRINKNSNTSAEISSPQSQTPVQKHVSVTDSQLDLGSFQSFPTLSSCSSKIESCEKRFFESTPKEYTYESQDSLSQTNSEKKFRRGKLFSEKVEGNSKNINHSFREDFESLDDVELKSLDENRFIVSTPKSRGSNSVPMLENLNASDVQEDFSPKMGSKSKWKNNSLNLSRPDMSLSAVKSKSFSGDSLHKNKDNKNSRVSLGDFISSDFLSSENKKEKKNKIKKRINPVKLNSQPQVNINPAFSEKLDDSRDSVTDILEKRQHVEVNNEKKIKSIVDSIAKLDLNKDIKLAKGNSNSSSETQAELELVTCISELKILSQIYSFLINENYCQNIMIELCFIVSLLVVQDYNKKVSDSEDRVGELKINKKFFGSIHNCVYFAVETLWLQRNIVPLLNLSALKLLSENIRIEKFNSLLKEFLVNAYCQRKSDEEIKRQNGLSKAGMQGNVSFQYETDNSENFTSGQCFRTFRKQRDLFYNILATWEANHLVRGWIFSVGLASKIRTLLSMSSDPINMLHLSRLFRNQLVMSCCGENQNEENFNEEILQLLPSADPNKILRLRARLTSSPKRQGPCPLPDFTGYQEFYKDFILCSNHSMFYSHLKNCLCDEILRLNETDLTGDIEDDDLCLDEQTQERYFHCTNILRLLAKFLGFVEFLPYRGEKPQSDQILNILCTVRHNTLPLFDVVTCLKTAFKKQKLTLTIPWLVSYLSMIDPYSAHLSTYRNVWRLLIAIYQYLRTFKNVKNSFYLKLVLGWIFQLPAFPSDEFYCVLDECTKNPASLSLEIPSGEEQLENVKTGLDSYDFIEETVLYSVCPYLNEINVILSENLGCSFRHITPVTTQENSFSKSQASKQLELRLEENFLHNQSSSTRKTIEFVTERIASVVIKHLIHHIIPKIKDAAWDEVDNVPVNSLKEAQSKSDLLAEKCYKELVRVCDKENWEICSSRSETALKALLSNDLQGSVADTCAKIVSRQATEKVQRWMQSHMTLALIKKDFSTIAKKKFFKKVSEIGSPTVEQSEACKNDGLYKLPNPQERGVIHNPEAWPASQALKAVRESIWNVYERSCSSKDLETVIEETIKTFTCRNDIIPAAEKTLFHLVLDLVVVVCVHFSSEGENNLEGILKKFFQLLKCVQYQNFSQNSLERIVCPRNVAMVLKESVNKEKAWTNLSNLISSLMEEGFLTHEQVEPQLLSILRQEWNKEEGSQFIKFLSQIHERYSRKNGCDKFSLLLEYMMETLNEDEPKSESFG